MNYHKIYSNLIERCQGRSIDGYKERHHIVPKCMGGSDEKHNIVELTAREHFIAHCLLSKIYPSNLKLVKAIAIMCIGQSERKLTNRMYGKIRRQLAKAQSECQSGIGNSQYGTMWIHNVVTNQNKKVKRTEQLQDGWIVGKYKPPRPLSKTDKLRLETLDRKVAKKKEYVKLFTKYYEIYTLYGFDEFVRITGYDKSLANLVQMFKRHVDGFIPQNGKKR